MAAAAEQLTEQTSRSWQIAHQAHPEVDILARERMASYMGGMAIRGEACQQAPEEETSYTLQDTLKRAQDGDPAARRYARNNVASDVSERLFKVGLQRPVVMTFEGGQLEQEGRPVVDIHRNTLENTVLIPEMVFRTRNELKNTLVFEALQAQGTLETHDAIVFSPSSTKMSTAQKEDYNFYLDTDSCSIQYLSADGENVTLETAFVAGKVTCGSERHDIAAIHKLAQKKGVKMKTDDGTDMVSYIVLVPKGEMPNGVSDVVELYDDASGGTFYGEAKQKQDYAEYAQKCYDNVASFDDTVELITSRLIAEAEYFETPMEAILRLDYLSERLTVEQAVNRVDINAAVFGPIAARHIEQARMHIENGYHQEAKQSLHQAQATAISGSCPLFKGAKSSESSGDDSSNGAAESKKKLMSCPHCDAKVFDDPCAKVLSCWDCGASVVNGRTTLGNGGTKAREAAARTLAKAEVAKKTTQTVGV